MFGRNQVVGMHDSALDKLHVNEMFYTLQGEGPLVGMPSIFIRFAGCNLRCTWCDTAFEDTAFICNTSELIDRCAAYADSMHVSPTKPLIVLTGGEPLLQNVAPFVYGALECGYAVQIETAGTVFRPLPDTTNCTIVCSPKTPHVHPMLAKRCEHWKYIVAHDDCDPLDGLPILATQEGIPHRKLYRAAQGTIWVQPRFDYLDTKPILTPDNASNAHNTEHAVNIAMKYGYRLSLQIHKTLGLR